MNKVEISGNIGQEIDVITLDSGKKVCNFSIAYNETYNDEKRTSWFRCKAWNDTAEKMTKLKKGALVMVEGKLYEEEYTDKEGSKKKSFGIVAFKVSAIKKKEAKEPVAA